MKAKEYYQKYGERIANINNIDDSKIATLELLYELADDVERLVDLRKATTDKSVCSIIEEVNGKWNAICDMLPTQVLRHNGFKTWFIAELDKCR